LQVQLNEPALLVQVALALQLCVLPLHSFTSVQLTPLPVKPSLQAQENDPSELVQVASAWQLFALLLHSLTSAQLVPLPV
jgi:hypothetical protein